MILDRFSLKDKVAIVTGAGTGIGQGISVGLAEAGAHIVCAARTAAQALAGKLAKMPPIALQTLKQLIYQSIETSFDVQLRTEGHASSILTQTEDYKEGVLSFLEKRPPVFKGM